MTRMATPHSSQQASYSADSRTPPTHAYRAIGIPAVAAAAQQLSRPLPKPAPQQRDIPDWLVTADS